jgi:hypothetical protein
MHSLCYGRGIQGGNLRWQKNRSTPLASMTTRPPVIITPPPTITTKLNITINGRAELTFRAIRAESQLGLQ